MTEILSKRSIDEQITENLVDRVVTLCEQAGQAILEVYQCHDGIEVDYKADDSPLTQADLAAHKILSSALEAIYADVHVVSEESALPPFEQRQQWSTYWLIDPLDGTKEFINRNGEFTVNVALIHQGRPVLGVVHVPVQAITYTGARGLGATKRSPTQTHNINVRSLQERQQQGLSIDVVASRRHGSDQLQQALAKLKNQFGEIDTLSMGSSLKFCVVAEGKADIYPRLAPTSEWDTGAAQAVVEAAGGIVVDANFQTLSYNQKSDILNPHFYVFGDKNWDWQAILG